MGSVRAVPRMEGRESTVRKVPLDQAYIGTHAFDWEVARLHIGKKWCCIEGCDLRIQPRPEGGVIGRVVNLRMQPVGWACQDHTQAILSATQNGPSRDVAG